MEKEALRALYRQIEEKGAATAALGGKADPFLAHPELDTRMSVALVFRPPESVGERIAEKLAFLHAAAPELYTYPASDFHVTVLDLLRGREGLVCSEELAGRYGETIDEVRVPPFRVCFQGMISSGEAVLVKGYHDGVLRTLRERLRRVLREEGLPLEERYETCSCHITAARFPCPVREPGLLAERLALCREEPLGAFQVNAIELVYHNWYDSRKTLLRRFAL